MKSEPKALTCRLCGDEIPGDVYAHRCREMPRAERFAQEGKAALELTDELRVMRLKAENASMRTALGKIAVIANQRGMFGSAGRMAKVLELAEPFGEKK